MSDQKKSRAADELIRIFEAKILHGELRDGDMLPPERDIVQTYSVSRTVVREAILALAGKGLISTKPGFRPVVREPSYDVALDSLGSMAARFLATPGGIKDLFDLRILVEASLVRQAAMRAKKGHLEKLRAALLANEAAIENSIEFYDTDIAFHAVLFDIPENDLLPSIHRAYTTWLRSYWVQMPRLPDRNRKNFISHKRIFDAILMRDPDAAERALLDHMADAWSQVRLTFPKVGSIDQAE